MPNQKHHAGKKKKVAGKAAPLDEIPLPAVGEVGLLPEDAPPQPAAAKRIHPRRSLPLVPAVGAAFKDVNALPKVSAAVAAKVKVAAMAEGLAGAPLADVPMPLQMATKPGVERWPVKTGMDKHVAQVGKNVINGRSVGVGIVKATVEELVRMGRPIGMRPATKNFDHDFHDLRLGVVERTVFVIEVDIIALKQEDDGDYHLVLQGASGQMMIGEAPTPTKQFVGASPWLANMKATRKEIDKKLVSPLAPAAFVQLDGTLVPRASLPEAMQPQALAVPAKIKSFTTPKAGQALLASPTFQTKVKPTHARITGVGFFDKVHGQTGVAQLNGIELHPILQVEWL